MITTRQVSAGTAPATLVVLPPGPCSVVLTSVGAGTAYVGAGTATTLSSSNGMPIPAGGVLPFTVPQGGASSTLQVVTASGTATVGYLISDSTAAG